MCGIVACIGNYEQTDLIDRLSIIKHRGPDDEQYLFLDKFGCGFVRLSIIDVDNGAQPITNENNTIIVMCNGEIYNYKDLTLELKNKGHIFKTSSDVEVLIHLYEEYGVKCIDYLQGMYAFVIYDAIECRLVVGRDHIGLKPLFYEVSKNNIFISSELKCFCGTNDDVASLMEKNLFGFILDTESTVYENVKQVKPGCVFYVDYPLLSRINHYEANYNIKESSLEDCLKKAVETHLLNSDVDVGISLSGGVDSSLIAVLCKEVRADVNTYTLTTTGGSEDAYYSRKLARKYGFNHTEITIDSVPAIDNNFNYALDYVLSDSGVFNSKGDIVVMRFYEKVAKYVKVMLSGDGGDELFGGYWMHEKPLGFKDKLLLNCFDDTFKCWLDRKFPENNECVGAKSVLDILFTSALPNYHLWTLDRSSMRYGVEARVPYLDVNVMYNVLNKESRIGKKLLNSMYLKYLPDYIVNRSKVGFCDALG